MSRTATDLRSLAAQALAESQAEGMTLRELAAQALREDIAVNPVGAFGRGAVHGTPTAMGNVARFAQSGLTAAPAMVRAARAVPSVVGGYIMDRVVDAVEDPLGTLTGDRLAGQSVPFMDAAGRAAAPALSDQVVGQLAQPLADRAGQVADVTGAMGQALDSRFQPMLQSGASRMGYSLGQSTTPMVGNLGATVLGGLAGGPVGAAVAGGLATFATEGGSTAETIYRDLRAQDVSEDEALTMAFATAVPAGAAKAAVEQGMGMQPIIAGAFRPLAERLGASAPTFRAAVMKYLAAAGMEGVEEVTQGTVDRFARSGVTGQGPTPLSREALPDIAQEAALGAAGGLLFGAPGVAADTARARQAAALRQTPQPVRGSTPETPAPAGDETPVTPPNDGVSSPSPVPATPNVAAATPDVARSPETIARIEFLFDELSNRPDMPDAERVAMEDEYAKLTGDPEHEASAAQAAPTVQGGDPAADQIGRVAGAADNAGTLRPMGEAVAGVVAPNGVEAAAQPGNVASGADQVPGSRVAQPAEVMAASVADMSGAELRARARELGVDDRGPTSAVRRRVESASQVRPATLPSQDVLIPAATVELQSPPPRTPGSAPGIQPSSTTQPRPATSLSVAQSGAEVESVDPAVVAAGSSQNPTPTRAPVADSASWMVVEKSSGRVVMETFDRRTANAINQEKYDVVPIEQYLKNLNRQIAQPPAPPTPTRGPRRVPAPSAPVPPTPAPAPSPAQSEPRATSPQSPTRGESATAASGTVSAVALDENRSTVDADLADISRTTGGAVTRVEPTTPLQRKITQRMSKLKRNVIFVTDESGTFNGVASNRDARTVYIRADATEKETVRTLAHELLHSTVSEDAALADELAQIAGETKIAQARAKYRGRLVDAFGEDSKVVRGFDANEALGREEGLAQFLEDAAAGDADAARMLYETPGLLGKIRRAVRAMLAKAGIRVGDPESRALLRLLDEIEKRGKAAPSDSVKWAGSRAGTTMRAREQFSKTAEAEYGRTARDTAAATIDDWGTNMDTMFSFPGPLPEDIKRALEGAPTVVRMMFKANSPNGGGPQAFANLGEDAYMAVAYAEAGLSDRQGRLDALRKDPDPENQLVAAVAQAAIAYEGKLPAKVGIPAKGLRMGDVFRVNGQAVRLVQDEDGNPMLLGGPFKGIDPRGIDLIPVDEKTHYTEDSKQALPIIAELVKEDLQQTRGVRGEEDATLSDSVPFSPRSMFDRTDDAKGTGSDQPTLFGIPSDARATTPPKLTLAEKRELYPAQPPKAATPRDRDFLDEYPTEDAYMQKYRDAFASRGQVMSRADREGVARDYARSVRDALSMRTWKEKVRTKNYVPGGTRAEVLAEYPGIKPNETVADYEKRMGTADTPNMFESMPRVGRSRPKSAVSFDTPIVGPSGAKLVSYEWSWTTELVDTKDDVVERRVSDWSESSRNDATNRDIVHKFVVQLPSGETRVTSLESALSAMGFTSNDNASKPVRNVASSLKTLAKNKMQLAAIEPEMSRRQRVRDDVGAMRFPSDRLVRSERAVEFKHLAQQGYKMWSWTIDGEEVHWEYQREGEPVPSRPGVDMDALAVQWRRSQEAKSLGETKEFAQRRFAELATQKRDLTQRIAKAEKSLGVTADTPMMFAPNDDNAISYLPPVDGSGHMTSDEPALIFEAKKGDTTAGYALVVMPSGKAPYVGQITIAPELRRQGIATNLYAEIGKHLKANNLPPLRPSRDLSPGTKRIWEKRMASGVMFSPLSPTIDVDGVQRPTTNSDGKPIARDEASVRNFWRWFANSRVVDEQGRPRVVYHGTEKGGFSVFDTKGLGKTTGTGAFFTDTKKNASTYSGTLSDVQMNTPEEDAEGYEYEKQSGIYGVYLKIADPSMLDFEGANWDSFDATGNATGWVVKDIEGEIVEFFDSKADADFFVSTNDDASYFVEKDVNPNETASTDDVVRMARDQGYDGVIIDNVVDEGRYGRGYGWGQQTYVVFDPSQIKSANANLGTFDPANPDIRFAPKGMSRIEQRNQERADRKIGSLEKRVDSEREKAESAKAAARATISVLQTQLRAAGAREKGLTKVVGILETMRARQEARADEATAENQARAAAMKQMRETQRQIEQIKDAVVRAVRDALPQRLHGQFITDIRKVKSASQLTAIIGKINAEALHVQALELESKLRKYTGGTDKLVGDGREIGRRIAQAGGDAGYTGSLTNPAAIERLVTRGRLKFLAGTTGARDAARMQITAFLQAAERYNTASDMATKRDALLGMEIAYDNLTTIIVEQRVDDRLVSKFRRERLKDAVSALASRLSSLATRTARRRVMNEDGTEGEGTKTAPSAKMGLIVSLADAETLMMLADGKIEGGEFYKRIYEPLREAMNRQFEIVDAMMTKADGHARRAGFADLADAEVRLFGLAGDANAISYDLPVEIGGSKKIPASQALKLYAMDQETLADTMKDREWKWDDDGQQFTIDYKQFDALVKAIPAEHRALVDALKAERDTLFDPFAKTIKLLTGTEPPKVFGYDPRRVSPKWMRQNKIETPIQTGPTGHVAASLESAGMGKARISTKAPLLATNFYADWKQSIDIQSRVIELAAPIRDAKVMIRNQKVADAITAKIHPRALDRLERMLDDVAGVNQNNPDVGNRIWSTLGRNVGKALTQLNVQSWLRNLGGVATLAPEMPASAFADGVRGAFSTKFGDMLEESAFLRRMYGQNVYALKSIQAYEGSTPDARGPGAVGTATRGLRIAARSGVSFGANVGRAVIQQPGAWRAAMEDLHQAMKSTGSIADGIGVMHWFASLPARIAYAGWKAEAKRVGENDAWAMKQMEQSLRRTQGMNDALMLNGIQSHVRGTFYQPFFMFTNDSVRMANMVMRAKMTGDRGYQAKVGAGILLSLAVGGIVTGALGREGLQAMLSDDDEKKKQEQRKQALQAAAWTAARDGLGIAMPGVTDRLVEIAQATFDPRVGSTASEAATGNPVAGMFGEIFDALAQAGRGAEEAISGDNKRGNTSGENITRASERVATAILRLYGSPLPSVVSQARRVGAVTE